MKIRSGFVSNSSSSSFVLEIDDATKVEEALVYKVEISGDLSNNIDIVISTVEELTEYAISKKFTLSTFLQYKGIIEKGHAIIFGSYFSDSDNCPELFNYGLEIEDATEYSGNIRTLSNGRMD
jgi:hypothetical protein